MGVRDGLAEVEVDRMASCLEDDHKRRVARDTACFAVTTGRDVRDSHQDGALGSKVGSEEEECASDWAAPTLSEVRKRKVRLCYRRSVDWERACNQARPWAHE